MFRILKVNLNCSQKANLLSDIAFRWNICTYLTSGVVKSEKKGEFRLSQFIEQILIFLGSIYRRGARRWRKLYRVNGHIFQAKRFNRVSAPISLKLT